MRRTILAAVAVAAVLLTGCGGGDDFEPAAAVGSVDEDGFTRGQRADIVRLTGLAEYYAKNDQDDEETPPIDLAPLSGRGDASRELCSATVTSIRPHGLVP